MRKVYVLYCLIVVLLIGFLGVTYSYEYNDNDILKFELIGEYEVNLLLNDKYVEHGVNVFYNGMDISSFVIIDSSLVDTSKVGDYKVKYEINIDGISEYIYRIVKVRENIKPSIILKGDKEIYLDLNGTYVEPGYEIYDNYDLDLYKKLIVTTNLVVTKVGDYKIEYKVSDSSGNETVEFRKIIVR